MCRIIICVILFLGLFHVCQLNKNIAYNIPDPGISSLNENFRMKYLFVLECTGIFNLCTDVDKERLGREAVKAIHEQMDDDKDGKIEASESRDVNIIKILFFSIKSIFFSLSKKN
jgi:hypothetical protein